MYLKNTWLPLAPVKNKTNVKSSSWNAEIFKTFFHVLLILFKLLVLFFYFLFYFQTCLSFPLIFFMSQKIKKFFFKIHQKFFFQNSPEKIQKNSEDTNPNFFSLPLYFYAISLLQEMYFLLFFSISQRPKYIDWAAASQSMLCTPIFHCGQVKVGRNDGWEQQSLYEDTESPLKQDLVMHSFSLQMKTIWPTLIHFRFEQVLLEEKSWWSLQDILSAVYLWKII